MKTKTQKTLLIFAFTFMAICISMLWGIRAKADEEVTVDGVRYSVGEDSVTVIGREGTLGDVVIPETVNGKSVTEIDDFAFFTCDKLTSIDLPKGLTTIGRYAFDGCINLTNIELPDGVTTIKDGAFMYCVNLTSINFPDSVTTIGDELLNGCDTDNLVIYCNEVSYAYTYATGQGFTTSPISK